MSDYAPKPVQFYSYHSNEPGCRANVGTDLELVVGSGGEQWVIVAPARVFASGSDRRYAGLPGIPLNLEIARPLELALEKAIADSSGVNKGAVSQSNITRLKIVSVWHGVVGLGMGAAVAQIALRFSISVNTDIP